jgi:hypothetical protein
VGFRGLKLLEAVSRHAPAASAQTLGQLLSAGLSAANCVIRPEPVRSLRTS